MELYGASLQNPELNKTLASMAVIVLCQCRKNKDADYFGCNYMHSEEPASAASIKTYALESGISPICNGLFGSGVYSKNGHDMYDLENALKLLSVIKTIRLDSDGFELDTDYGFIKADFAGDKVGNVQIDFDYQNTKVFANIALSQTERKVEVKQTENYLDVYEIYSQNKDFYKSTTFTIDTALDILKDGSLFAGLSGTLAVDYENPYIALNADVFFNENYKLQVVYEGDTCYVQLENIFVKMPLFVNFKTSISWGYV